MNPSNNATTIELLAKVRDGQADAAAQLLPLVYEDLRRHAAAVMVHERAGHTLTPTALVHEAYARIAGGRIDFKGRTHFAAVASIAMRRILVEHARARLAEKRGGLAARARLGTAIALADDRGPEPLDVLALDAALVSLERLSPRQAKVVELRFFAGLTVDEAAEALGVSISTIEADWRMARAWLHRELTQDSPPK